MNDRHENMDARLQRLIKSIVEGSATVEETKELESHLQSSAEVRRHYCRALEVHAHLHWLFRASESVDTSQFDLLDEPETTELYQATSVNELSTAELLEALPLPGLTRIAASENLSLLGNSEAGVMLAEDATRNSGGLNSSAGSEGRWTWGRGRVLAYAATVLVIVGSAVAYQQLQKQTRMQEFDTESAIMVATLQSNAKCVWSEDNQAISKGSQLKSGSKLQLLKGTAQMRFGSGAAVVIDSPADFELLTANSMRLNSGTLAARVNGPVKDFVVELRNSSIVDLGTSFGVHCEAGKPTEVEVFEGAVKVMPETPSAVGRVLGLGAFSRVVHHGEDVSVDDAEPNSDRFGDLLELLWLGRNVEPDRQIDPGSGNLVEARFDEPPLPEAVDTFYGATAGRGWLTSWMAAGNPVGEIRRENPLSGPENPYLRLQFTNSRERTIAREYGSRNGFDPNLPHVISWKWRYEGNPEHFANHFEDRVHFFGNRSFRRQATRESSWLIGLCTSDQDSGKVRPVTAGHWYFFDRSEPGNRGGNFHERNMIDTGMELKPGVVYHFAVAVYPEEARYDAAIRDDSQMFYRTGLNFRSGEPGANRMVHFGLNSSHAKDHAGFSLDSVCIEPWTGDQQVFQHLDRPEVVATSVAPLVRTRAEQPNSTLGYSGIWYPSFDLDREYGFKYAGGLGTFPQQHVPLAVYSKEANKTFFVYGGSSARGELLHVVSYYDHASGKLARPHLLDNKHTSDANDCPTLSIDAEGYLWVFANSHGAKRPAFIWRSVDPYSIDAFKQVVATNFSYAQPWPLPSGEMLLLHTRYGKKNAKSLFQMRSRDGQDWSVPELLASTQRGHYQVSWQQGDRIGTIMNFHPTEGGLDARTNLYYQETLNGGKTWRNAAGAKIKLPLKSEKNTALVENYRLKKQLVYLKDLAFTPEGHPVALYLTSYGPTPGPNNGPRQFTTAHWNGSDWKIRRVTSTDHNYDHASLYVEPDGAWRMIGTTGVGPQSYQTGGEVEMWLSRDQGLTWNLGKQLTQNSEFNHHYPRRPVNAHPDFYAFWADGHARDPSVSRMYFCTQDGRVYRMPEQIDQNQTELEPQRIGE